MTEIFSILFWTPEQKKLIDSFSSNESIVLLGDYGTGKTVVIQSVAEKLRNSGKRLVYINALDCDMTDGKEYYKTWKDVLDVIVELRFVSEVTVLDTGTLRKQYLERKEGSNINLFSGLNWIIILNKHKIVTDKKAVSTLELIDDYISNLANANNTVVGNTENTE